MSERLFAKFVDTDASLEKVYHDIMQWSVVTFHADDTSTFALDLLAASADGIVELMFSEGHPFGDGMKEEFDELLDYWFPDRKLDISRVEDITASSARLNPMVFFRWLRAAATLNPVDFIGNIRSLRMGASGDYEQTVINRGEYRKWGITVFFWLFAIAYAYVVFWRVAPEQEQRLNRARAEQFRGSMQAQIIDGQNENFLRNATDVRNFLGRVTDVAGYRFRAFQDGNTRIPGDHQFFPVPQDPDDQANIILPREYAVFAPIIQIKRIGFRKVFFGLLSEGTLAGSAYSTSLYNLGMSTALPLLDQSNAFLGASIIANAGFYTLRRAKQENAHAWTFRIHNVLNTTVLTVVTSKALAGIGASLPTFGDAGSFAWSQSGKLIGFALVLIVLFVVLVVASKFLDVTRKIRGGGDGGGRRGGRSPARRRG